VSKTSANHLASTQVVHFDDTGAPSHDPVNGNSLDHNDKNALTINATASSPTTKVATFTVNKGAGGAEAGVEYATSSRHQNADSIHPATVRTPSCGVAQTALLEGA